MPDENARYNLAAMDTRVDALENEVESINSRLGELNDKFDRVLTAFASEFRSSIAGLSTQINERNKTPWGTLFTGMAVTLSIVTVVGHQALSPIEASLAILQAQIVPRMEFNLENGQFERRLAILEDAKNKRVDRLEQRVDELTKENNLLRGQVKP